MQSDVLPPAPPNMFATHLGAPLRDYSYQQPSLPQSQPLGHLRAEHCHLIFRQQPSEALVTLHGKEKIRKPVDPPPILELTVHNRQDPTNQWLQNPYLFMCATLHKIDSNGQSEPYNESREKSLAGTLVSSLHRLKDVSNKDGGFFVFGDISVKVLGEYTLCFTLYEFHPEDMQVQHLGSVTSKPFKVLAQKDFKGLEESTYLSRAFSDQGVRLRLRKEPRAALHKRAYPSDSPSTNTPLRPNVEYPPAKKSRTDYTGAYATNSSSYVPTTASFTPSTSNQPSMPYPAATIGSGTNMMSNNLAGSMYNFGAPANQYQQTQFNPSLPSTMGQQLGYGMYQNYTQRNHVTSAVDNSTFSSQFSSADPYHLE